MIPSTYPAPAPPLSTRFAVPTQEQHDLNPSYWDAYAQAQLTVTQVCPSATGVKLWEDYHSTVLQSLPPTSPHDTSLIGSNQCVLDASGWEWQWNPLSGRNKVYP